MALGFHRHQHVQNGTSRICCACNSTIDDNEDHFEIDDEENKDDEQALFFHQKCFKVRFF